MTLVLRAKSTRLFTFLFIFLAGATLIASTINGGVRELLWATPVCGLIVAIGWAVFWNPRVEVGPSGVRVVNIVREYLVPWTDLRLAENRWGLYIYTRHDSRKISAWAVPSNVGLLSNSWRDRKKTPESPASINWEDGGRVTKFAHVRFVTDLIQSRAGHLRKNPRLRAELASQNGEQWPDRTTVNVQVAPIAAVGTLFALTALMFATN
ncbi:PH domain-containing protein [Trueperella bialowiezensis]|uniref:Protein of uncharacterized function (DUF2581) n=1 Tax=Trueperella bialowiezensis TaxID=312285 RepID=A0A3S4YXF6_9ACTO|nr:PH domain-containing protein [Trueperella bialowiezensis]VEI12950.1 Protein of uncharacterised function (DUF2581) [Trueperella bialowiezensis]